MSEDRYITHECPLKPDIETTRNHVETLNKLVRGNGDPSKGLLHRVSTIEASVKLLIAINLAILIKSFF